MKKTIVDVVTGEQRTVDLSAEEVAKANAQAADAADEPKPKTLMDRIIADPEELAKLKAALGI
jgi:hypothetical protein